MMDEMCCKSVGTDLSMLDIDDFITEISQLKKEVALLETKLRLRGDEGLKREDSELSLTLLCYTESKPTDTQDTTVCDSNQDLQDEESTDQTSTESLDSVCNAGEQQQILQTKLNMCSVKLFDCSNLMMETGKETTEEKDHTDDDEDAVENFDNDDDDDFIPSDEKSDSCSEGEITSSTSKERRTAQSFSCTTCGKTLSSQGHLKRHEEKHNEEKLYTCRRCKISFTTLQEQRCHYSEEHREKKKKTKNNLFDCEHCGKNFVFLSYLKIHMKTHSGVKSFKCTECNKYFTSKGNLDVHQRIHTGEKPYKCPHCKKRFRYKPYLKKHVRIHTNERPYQCSECGKTFTDLGSLKSHQKTHSEEKPYQCSYCDKRFRHKSQLIVHERLHTGEKPYLCSYCASFGSVTLLLSS
ncbi:uncharacterized protein [Misgurnus anguillicaudatus]|uniref:uncharacterized protein n=1 Tax=Misgurnus anguillicaudatus TaxID=75329 RepID=UPI003CCF4E39